MRDAKHLVVLSGASVFWFLLFVKMLEMKRLRIGKTMQLF
jgi:hypothetical protein